MGDESVILQVVLALKNGLVTPGQVLECCASCADTPSKPLVDLLVEKGYLTAKGRKVLESLAEEKSSAYAGDAGHTLVALDMPESVRQFLLAIPLDENAKKTILKIPFSGNASVVQSIRQRFDVDADVDLGSPDEQETMAKAPATRPEPAGGKDPENTLGKHLILGEIARGGMGAIIEARDPDLRREVAVKVMLPGATANPDVVARFVEEAQVQGQLEHPNVCPVHDIAQGNDGLPYFLMKRVRGKPFSAVIDEYHEDGEIKLTRLIEIFLKVCDAIGFGHSRGVIHRDLKPANVMVGDYGEVLVMDWGLAKVHGWPDQPDPPQTHESKGGASNKEESHNRITVDPWILSRTAAHQEDQFAPKGHQGNQAERARTMDGDIIGTPAYMPPEQAEGDVAKMNETSDIYSLGAILYEVLGGAPPFEGSPHNIIYKVIRGKVVPPSERKESGRPVPRELEAVALKAMAREQKHRYAGVKELRDDILAWTEGRTLQAVEYSSLERTAKWVMRNKALSAVLGVVLLAILVVGGVFWWSAAAQRIAKETGLRIAKEEQAKAARATVKQNMDEAVKRLAVCEAAYRKAAAPKLVEMEVVPEAQSVACCFFVEKGPMNSPGPYNENAPEPEWEKGPKPPPPVGVPVRELGIERLKDATDHGSLATLFADRAVVRAKAENFMDLLPGCESLTIRCRLAYAKALSASGDLEKAGKELEKVPEGTAGRRMALAYARELCPLTVTSMPSGATVKLLFMPGESAKTAGRPVREETTPVRWTGIRKGTYMLRFEMGGFAPVGYHLRLGRDLLPEGAHELKVLAGKDKAFAKSLEKERKRLSGEAPAHRRVHVDMLPASKAPGGFIVIPAGSFLMGEDNEPVYLDTYLAMETELSVGDWSDFLEEAGARKRARVGVKSLEEQCDFVWGLICRAPEARKLPAATLSWDDARAYLRRRNSRDRGTSGSLFALPTEAMWEKAARGVDGRVFPWGNAYAGEKINGEDLRPISNLELTFWTNYDPVDLDRGTSVYGLKHAGGNLWEWYVNLPGTIEECRSLKGGGYSNDASMLRLAGRLATSPYYRFHNSGFRVFVPLVSGSGR